MLMRVIEAELDSGVQESKGILQAQGEPGTRGSGADWAHGGGVGGSRHRPVDPRRARTEHRPRALWVEFGQSGRLRHQGQGGLKPPAGTSSWPKSNFRNERSPASHMAARWVPTSVRLWQDASLGARMSPCVPDTQTAPGLSWVVSACSPLSL